MRLLSALLAALGAWVACAQVKTPQPDLKVQTVWDNVWGIVQLVFLPGGKVMTVHKPGELHVYDSINSKAQDYVTLLDIQGEVYSWWDHGLLSAAVHPEFPQQPYVFIAYSAEYPGSPWNDQCVPDARKVAMTNPPDTRPYCKSMAKVVRLKVDPDFTNAVVEQELFHDWCSSTYTHHVGTINFLADGSMVYGAGDGSHFQGLDHGMPQDECTDPKGPKDQGVFTAQKDGYLRGKFIRVKPEALLKNAPLVKGVDYVQIAKGARNPFRNTIDPKTGDLYFGDVGSSVWEEINRIPNPLAATFQQPNFGWPCVEGMNAVSDIYQTWLRSEGLLATCQDAYDGKSTKPVFAYRYGAVDPDFPDECADADASVSGITFYAGQKLPAKYQGKLFWVDYSKKCGFWFDQGADGQPDFSHPHAFMTTVGAQAGGVTDVKTGADGYLYVADYAGGKVYRFGDANDRDMDALLTRGAGVEEADGADNGMWIDSAPMPYSWAYGDTVHYRLHTPMPVSDKQVHWRVTNGHCVKNPCTGTNDCHMHEVSLSPDSSVGMGGSFRPSPHPMESYIKILATVTLPDGSAQKAEYITHALTYNYKLVSDPPGLPIIIEEFTCLQSPCITSQMAKTNPGFAAQSVQVYDDEVYRFDSWTATNVGSGRSKTVKRTIFEETADADYIVRANYKRQPTQLNAALGVPYNLVAEGDAQRVSLSWDAPTALAPAVAGAAAPAPGVPDFVILTIRDAATGAVVKDHMTTGAKAQVVLEMPPGAAGYVATAAWFDSSTNQRGLASAGVQFATAAAPLKGKVACLGGSQFSQVMQKSKLPGLAESYQLSLLGTYPTTLHKGQKVRLTFDVVSETATQLLVNVLSKTDFKWVGGKTLAVPARTDSVLNLEFTIDGAVQNKEEYFIDALLVADPKDYTTAFVEDTSADKIMGVARPDPAALAAAAAAANAPPPGGAVVGGPVPPLAPAAGPVGGPGVIAAPATPGVMVPGPPGAAAPAAVTVAAANGGGAGQ